jgi:asparagine synthase (glutamine-hydrolysing)
MSVQFGRWSFDGPPPAPDYIEKVRAALAPYGPDSNESYSEGGVKILYRAFHTTKESRRETQPLIFASGTVIAWDGRLDNRAALISELRDFLSISSTDVAIVAAAYEKWGTKCFAKLIGDWALSIWNPISRSLILAKDFVGTRHLYYSVDRNQVTWCTILDPLVRFEGKTFAICEEYIAGWFSMYPAVDLTPYIGIHSVPPSSFVLLRPGKHIVSRYWDFDPEKTIRYRTDAEYEEHFRAVFSTAVQRRLRSDRPVLAELSGGIDSSSIVCMADIVISRGAAVTPRLDTISWYNDSDPNNDERPYFTKVEKKRGFTGCHIDLATLRDTGPQKPFEPEFDSDHFAPTPIPNNRLPDRFKLYAAFMRSQGHRVTLSGLGGEQATGAGVPTPTPELQNLLARARFIKLARQMKAWASKMNKPQRALLWESVRGFFPVALAGVPKDMRAAPWLHSGFVRRNQSALRGYPSRVKLFGPLPSFQNNITKLESERRQQVDVNLWHLQSELLRDVRYPYLDRDFLEFMYAIPREQVVRVGKRRALMKRALVSIVPNEILNRRRIAFGPQPSMKNSSTEWLGSIEIGEHMVSSSMGIIDANRFGEALQKAWYDADASFESLVRTLTLESWLQHLRVQGVLTNAMSQNEAKFYPLEGRKAQAAAQPKGSAS